MHYYVECRAIRGCISRSRVLKTFYRKKKCIYFDRNISHLTHGFKLYVIQFDHNRIIQNDNRRRKSAHSARTPMILKNVYKLVQNK